MTYQATTLLQINYCMNVLFAVPHNTKKYKDLGLNFNFEINFEHFFQRPIHLQKPIDRSLNLT